MGFKSDLKGLFTTHLSAANRNKFIDAWGESWPSTIPDPNNPGQTIPNSQTKPDFAVDEMVRVLREKVTAYEDRQLRMAIVVPNSPVLN